MTRPARLKALSLLLILCLLLQHFPALPVVAEETAPSDTALPATEPAQPLTEQCRILDHVDADVFASGNHVARLPEEEQLYSYVFQNADGSKTVYYMDQAVKFVDANGIVQEKNLTLTAVASDLTPNAMGITPTAGYTTACNDVGLYLPLSPADGIRLSYGAQNVTVIPQGGDSGVTASVDGGSIVYRDYYGPGMSLVYTPSLSGVKEDIVLSAYTGVTEFTFTLRTNGLNLYQANGRYFLAASKTATERFDLGDVVAFDANGRFSVGSMTVRTVMPGQAYTITLSVSEEYLTAPDTIYPVRIDPIVTYRGTNVNDSCIEDAGIFQGQPNLNTGTWIYNRCGYYDSQYGISRVVVRINGMYDSDLWGDMTMDDINSVTFHIKDATGSAGTPIKIYPLINNSWTETGVTWNNIGGYINTVYATASPGYNQHASFDITDLVLDWADGICGSSAAGFIMIAEQENSVDRNLLTSECATESNRPYVVLNYDTPSNLIPYFEASSITVEPGHDYYLKVENAVGTPVFSSSNTNVAIVDGGYVEGVNPGTATITAVVDGFTITTTVYVVIEDGIYKIRNEYTSTFLAMKDGQIGSAATAIVGNYIANTAQYLGQLWQVTYIGNGEYSLRPLLHDSCALNLNSLSHINLSRTSNDADLQTSAKWKINANGGGFSISNALLNYVLRSPDSGNQIIAASFDNSDDRELWYLDAVETADIPIALIFFDLTSGEMMASSCANSDIKVAVPINSSMTLAQQGLDFSVSFGQTPSPSVVWTSSNSAVASVSNGSDSGKVAAHSAGKVTITASINTNYVISYSLTVITGNMSVQPVYDNAYDAKITNPESTIMQYMDDLCDYCLYELGIELSVLEPILIQSHADTCPNMANGICGCDGCANSNQEAPDMVRYFENHHTNIANILYHMNAPTSGAAILYTGHKTCYNPIGGSHIINGVSNLFVAGIADPVAFRVCISTTTLPSYTYTDISRTTIHEFLHLLGTIDHYGLAGHKSSQEMGPLYNSACIYGENKNNLNSIILCQGCKNAITNYLLHNELP